QVSEAVWLTSFNGAHPVELNQGVLTLAVPSSVVKERIEGRYLALVRDALTEAGADEVALSIQVRTDLAVDHSHGDLTALDGLDHDRLATETVSSRGIEGLDLPAPSPGSTPWPSELHDETAEPRFSFESFVIGASN